MGSLHQEWSDREDLLNNKLVMMPPEAKAFFKNLLKEEFYAGAASTVVIYAVELKKYDEDATQLDLAYREASESILNELESYSQKFKAGTH